jgi:hypothetical protein
MERFNELVILVLSYFTWTFSDYNSDAEIKYFMGWGFIGVLGFAIFINVVTILFTEVISKI